MTNDRLLPTGSSAGCRFCRLSQYHERTPDHDRVIAESDRFAAVSSVGSLVDGWLLIVSRLHRANLAEHYREADFREFRLHIQERLEKNYMQPVRLFEHGPVRAGSVLGCGIDHAHLHLVPLRESLTRVFPRIASDLAWKEVLASQIASVAGNSEYLFYSDEPLGDPTGWLAIPSAPLSQFFRRAVAVSLGREQEFDYRQFPFPEISRRTIATMAH